MEEDEDVMFEGQELQKYLKDLGFNDMEVAFRGNSSLMQTEQETSGGKRNWILNSLISAWQWIRAPLGCMRMLNPSKLFNHVNLILGSGLLFEDDAEFIGNVFGTCERKKLSVQPVVHGNAVDLFSQWFSRFWNVSIFPMIGFIFFCILWDWRNLHQYKHDVFLQKKLLNILKDLYLISWKAVKLVQENELILRGFTLAKTGSTVSRLEDSRLHCMARKWQSSPGLHKALTKTLSQAINIFSLGTRKLMLQCPLFTEMDDTSHYLAYLDANTLGIVPFHEDHDIKLSYLKKLHHVYLLLQSEFLRRLALCFCKELWKERSSHQLGKIMNTIGSITASCLELQLNLALYYKTFYSYGIKETSQEVTPFHIRNTSKDSDLYIAVHSAGLHMQTALLNLRSLEEKLEQQKELQIEDFSEMESCLLDTVQKLEICKHCCEESEKHILKITVPTKPVVKEESLPKVLNDEETKIIIINNSNVEDSVEDEVFESEIAHGNNDVNNDDNDDQQFINAKDYEYEQMAKQLSKKVLDELKLVLVDKAEKWKEREAKVLRFKQEARVQPEVNSSKDDINMENEKAVNFKHSITDHSTCTSDAVAADLEVQSEIPYVPPQEQILRTSNTDNISCFDVQNNIDISTVPSSSSSENKLRSSPRHKQMYATETFRPLKDDLKVSVGLYLSNEALAKFQALSTGVSDTFSGIGEKSSSEESFHEQE